MTARSSTALRRCCLAITSSILLVACAAAKTTKPVGVPVRPAATVATAASPSASTSASTPAARCAPPPKEERSRPERGPESPIDHFLLSALASSNEMVRMRAAADATKLSPPARWAVPPLRAILKDKKELPGVQGFAAVALGKLGASEAVDDIVALVRAGNLQTADGLAPMGAAALPAVRRAYASGRDFERDLYLLVIEQILRDSLAPETEGRPVVADLMEALLGPSDARASTAASALAFVASGARDQAPALIKALTDPRASRRALAAWLLGYVDPDPVVTTPPLRRLAHDVEPAVRVHVASTMGVLGADDASPLLVELLGSEDVTVRRATVFGFRHVIETNPAALSEAARRALDRACEDEAPGVSKVAVAVAKMLQESCPAPPPR